MTKKLTICFVSHSSGNAGAEKAFPKLLEGLTNKGINIIVLLPAYGPVVSDLNKRNILYKIIPYSRWLSNDTSYFRIFKRLIKTFLAILPVLKTIKKWKCDLVYTNTSTICIGALAAKLARIPHIWHFREFGLEDYGYKYDLGRRFSQWIMNKFSTICFVNSNAVKKKYQKFIPDKKLRILYEAYDNSDWKSSLITRQFEKLKFNCVIVGTLLETKGQKDAIQAIYELYTKGIEVKLFIIGDGEKTYKENLLSLTIKLGINHLVEFTGYLDFPQVLINQCEVLLMCSRNEAFGLVTLEAMELGKPVIGSQTGGTLELIKDGFNGFLYTPGNYLQLSEKIRYLYENSSILKVMGQNAKKWADENFNPDKYVLNTLLEIKKILK